MMVKRKIDEFTNSLITGSATKVVRMINDPNIEVVAVKESKAGLQDVVKIYFDNARTNKMRERNKKMFGEDEE